VRRLDDGEEGKIILKEMMKMATALGIDTICEGVETESQVRFLQEIACSKLQGYFFMKPVPPEQILEKYTVEIIAENNITGVVAVAIGVLSISEPDEHTTYEDIAMEKQR